MIQMIKKTKTPLKIRVYLLPNVGGIFDWQVLVNAHIWIYAARLGHSVNNAGPRCLKPVRIALNTAAAQLLSFNRIYKKFVEKKAEEKSFIYS